MSENAGGQIDNVMRESRLFPPSDEFASQSRIGSLADYEELYERARQDPEAFWGDLAREELHWFEDFHTVLDWNEPVASWFVGGKTNASYNCLDIHLETDRADQPAIIWEGEPE